MYKEVIETMVSCIKKAIINDVHDADSKRGYERLKMLLAAYNTYQEQERDGVGYIFNINNTDDLKCCIEGGMTTKEICDLYNESEKNTLQYFYFGCNYPQPKPIATWNELRVNLIACLDELLPYVIGYPYIDSYRAIYETYVTEQIIN